MIRKWSGIFGRPGSNKFTPSLPLATYSNNLPQALATLTKKERSRSLPSPSFLSLSGVLGDNPRLSFSHKLTSAQDVQDLREWKNKLEQTVSSGQSGFFTPSIGPQQHRMFSTAAPKAPAHDPFQELGPYDKALLKDALSILNFEQLITSEDPYLTVVEVIESKNAKKSSAIILESDTKAKMSLVETEKKGVNDLLKGKLVVTYKDAKTGEDVLREITEKEAEEFVVVHLAGKDTRKRIGSIMRYLSEKDVLNVGWYAKVFDHNTIDASVERSREKPNGWKKTKCTEEERGLALITLIPRYEKFLANPDDPAAQISFVCYSNSGVVIQNVIAAAQEKALTLPKGEAKDFAKFLKQCVGVTTVGMVRDYSRSQMPLRSSLHTLYCGDIGTRSPQAITSFLCKPEVQVRPITVCKCDETDEVFFVYGAGVIPAKLGKSLNPLGHAVPHYQDGLNKIGDKIKDWLKREGTVVSDGNVNSFIKNLQEAVCCPSKSTKEKLLDLYHAANSMGLGETFNPKDRAESPNAENEASLRACRKAHLKDALSGPAKSLHV